MLGALAGSHKVGIAVVAGVFICFALASAMLIPRYRESFPGRGLRFFVALSVLLALGMLATIVVLAKEPKEESEARGGETTEMTTTDGGTTTTTTGQTTTAVVSGDPAAGKVVFQKAGCAACHMLKAANATGTVGPNLDEAKPSPELVIDRVTNGKGAMPPFEGQLSEKEIGDVAAFVVSTTQQS